MNDDFWLKIGDRVVHKKDAEWVGTVTHIDQNLIPGYGVTTCLVLYDDDSEPCIQWTNKLELVDVQQ